MNKSDFKIQYHRLFFIHINVCITISKCSARWKQVKLWSLHQTESTRNIGITSVTIKYICILWSLELGTPLEHCRPNLIFNITIKYDKFLQTLNIFPLNKSDEVYLLTYNLTPSHSVFILTLHYNIYTHCIHSFLNLSVPYF